MPSEAVDRAAELGGRLNDVFGNVVATVEALRALRGYQRGLLGRWVNAFFDDLVVFSTRMAELIGSEEMQRVLDTAATAMQQVHAALAGVDVIIQQLTAIRGYRKGLLPRWLEAFVSDIQDVLNALATVNFRQAGVDAGNSFADGLLSTAEAIRAAMEQIMAPLNLNLGAGLPAALLAGAGGGPTLYNYGTIMTGQGSSGGNFAAALEQMWRNR